MQKTALFLLISLFTLAIGCGKALPSEPQIQTAVTVSAEKEESTTSVIANDVLDQKQFQEEPITQTPADDEYVYRVSIDNMRELADTGIIPEALDYIEPYLDQYFAYYLGTEDRYSAVYVKDTYKQIYDSYEFKVYVEELDLEIDCIYVASEKYYFLESRFNPNGE